MGGAHKINRKIYWVIFAVLAILTLLEVGIAEIDGNRNAVIFGLVALAVAKAACVLLWYMHLIDESSVLKKTVILPFLVPALYAVVLIAEAIYRGGIARFVY
jgi:caa(3)-type oxidase subunit IV